jgi:dTDP-4-dehydrorhamnose reductase
MSQLKIVILGGSGMLGHKLFQVLRARFPGTLCTMRQNPRLPPFAEVDLLQGSDVIPNVDVTDPAALRQLLGELRPDVIVNCVGVVKQREQAKSPIPSITINSLLPHQLAALAAGWGGRVIHFSTDCVFSGQRGNYTEADNADADDLYGKSKFLGEVATDNALTLRTSIIGRELVEHRGLLDWFLAQNYKAIRGYRRVTYSGVTTNQMAEVVTDILQHHPTLSGLYQVVAEPISKYDLLCLARDAYGLEVQITPVDEPLSDRSMSGEKLRAATGYVSPPWPLLMQRLAADPTPYAKWVKP